MENERIYLAIDLKSFYASVECVERNLDPLDTNLLVADRSRTEKTICLAVSPSLKSLGIPGRARLFQVSEKVRKINQIREKKVGSFIAGSFKYSEIKRDKRLKLQYIIAKPRMAFYIEYSKKIYEIYLRYVSADDIHVYSIDEVFIDISSYLKTYNKTAHELAMTMIRAVLKETGITATAGIGTNLYLAKIAMDVVAKNMPADSDGVRIAELDEIKYRRLMWNHRPISDFWRVGKGYRKKLEKIGIYTMGDIALCSIGKAQDFYNEELLYKLFGKNAELLIDHAWGYEPCKISDIKAYKPSKHSMGSGQVLKEPYSFKDAKLVCWEMADSLSLEIFEKNLYTEKIVLTVGYDIENIDNPDIDYQGEIVKDPYGRMVPKHAHGTWNLGEYTSSGEKIREGFMNLFKNTVNPKLLIRRMYLSLENVLSKDQIPRSQYRQMDIYDLLKTKEAKDESSKKEKAMQETMIKIKRKFGKNAVLRAKNLEEGSTTIERNEEIGGHKA